MELKRLFMEELERQAVASRKAIERVPEGRNSFKPHPRSMELGYLAALVASMPGWVAMMIGTDELDLDGNGKSARTQPVETREELLALLDKSYADACRALTGTTEEHLLKPWKLRMGPQVLSYRPRYSSILDGAFTHLAHHRGQLTVYLRLLEASVPAIYGPSADEWQ
jgi:uncharacterized damage-inducible protein DinB